MAEVRTPAERATAPGSSSRSSGRMSANTGRSPFQATAWALAEKVNDGRTTSPDSPLARSDSNSPAVPEPTATTWRTPQRAGSPRRRRGNTGGCGEAPAGPDAPGRRGHGGRVGDGRPGQREAVGEDGLAAVDGRPVVGRHHHRHRGQAPLVGSVRLANQRTVAATPSPTDTSGR